MTTDPALDTPAVLGEYLDRFDADLPQPFIGLTGDQETIDQAQLSTGVPLAEDDGRLHSSLLLLYGSDDEAHVAFDAGNTSRDIAADLRRGGGRGVRRAAARLLVVAARPCWRASRSPGRRRRTSAAGRPAATSTAGSRR